MKKSKLTLGVVTALVAIPAITACDVTAKEGVVLTYSYTDASGNTQKVDYHASDLFDDYLTSTSAASTAFTKIQELLIRQSYETGDANTLATLKSEAQLKVSSVKTTAADNASNNGTTYQAEFEKLLESEGVDNVDELFDKKLYEVEEDHYKKNYFVQKNLNKMRSGEKWANLSTDALIEKYGPISQGYIEDKMPYHVSHILVKFASASSNDHTQATVSEAESKKLSNVVKELAGAKNTSVSGTDASASRLTFGSIAQLFSEDGSASSYGDLGIMDRDTEYVPEFKLGLYAFEALYSSGNSYADTTVKTPDGTSQTLKENLLPSDEAKDIDGNSVLADFTSRGIGTIPYGAFVAMGNDAVAKDPNLGYEVNGNDSHFYPRNVLFNKYFNNHAIAVITPNKIDYNDYLDGAAPTGSESWSTYKTSEVDSLMQVQTKGTLEATYAALPGFQTDTTNILPGIGSNVLTTSNGQIVLAVRAGASGSYEGMHFIVVDRSALSQYGTYVDETTKQITQNTEATYTANKKTSDITSLDEYYTMLTPGKVPSATSTAFNDHDDVTQYPYYVSNGEAVAKTTYVNKLISSTETNYSEKAAEITSKVKTNWSDAIQYYQFEELLIDDNGNEKITFVDEDLGKLVTNYIKTRRLKSYKDWSDDFDDDWVDYAEYLEQQDAARAMRDDGNQSLISETCAIQYGSDDAKNNTGDWAKGGPCSNGKNN
ncbi:MAG: hypothetical protein K6F32_03575 [Bacilli bacterium]|nr:hypothetical protein [Bacilli bacterium]